jgi:hypothetical protein
MKEKEIDHQNKEFVYRFNRVLIPKSGIFFEVTSNKKWGQKNNFKKNIYGFFDGGRE